MIHVLEAQHPLLKKFVDSIYIFKKGAGGLEFTAYPSTNTPVAMMRNTAIRITDERIYIDGTDTPNHLAMACHKFSGSLHLQYLNLVDEIAINFKPLGFASFTQSKPEDSKMFSFAAWDAFMPQLFCDVFEATDEAQQLQYIEQFLLQQYRALPDEAALLKALELLADMTTDHKMQDIAAMVGMHYKQLYRQFTEYMGYSPAHHRKLVKFRSSVVSKLQQGDAARLVDICYAHDYTDQAYFIKQFKELTGEKPARFFKDITSFGNDKVIFKMD